MRKFLIDENMNQKAVRAIPTKQKGFDILYPELGGFKGSSDPIVRKRTVQEERVLVTCDRDFSAIGPPSDLLRNGVLWIRPSPRISQRRITDMLRQFCEFLQKTFPSDPYNFGGKLFEIHERGVQITTAQAVTTSYNF